MKNVRIASALVILAALTACATPYKKDGFSGGYSHMQMGDNVFKVSFDGNRYSKAKVVNDYLLLRSAEVALENGFRYFQIAGTQDNSVSGVVPIPGTATTTVAGNTATTNYFGGGLAGYTIPGASQVIVCSKEKAEGYGLDAQLIVKSLRDAYGIRAGE